MVDFQMASIGIVPSGNNGKYVDLPSKNA